jgi:hypothetical protein
MSEKKTKAAGEAVRVTEIPQAEAFTGSLLLRMEPVEFCPHDLLDKLKFPKEGRPVFILRPLGARDRHWMDADSRKMSTGGMLWAKENGIDIQDPKNLVLVVTKFSEFSDWEKRRDIVRRSIVGFKSATGLGNFIKADDDDGLHPKMFEQFPDELVNVIDYELVRMASLSSGEVLGL